MFCRDPSEFDHSEVLNHSSMPGIEDLQGARAEFSASGTILVTRPQINRNKCSQASEAPLYYLLDKLPMNMHSTY